MAPSFLIFRIASFYRRQALQFHEEKGRLKHRATNYNGLAHFLHRLSFARRPTYEDNLLVRKPKSRIVYSESYEATAASSASSANRVATMPSLSHDMWRRLEYHRLIQRHKGDRLLASQDSQEVVFNHVSTVPRSRQYRTRGNDDSTTTRQR
ncbi:hypothetical protein ACRALDRAFT_1066046 [Sodiomyces alcalophilus JCM 7366]|uniref:uncharacterized protein n=1 Tax=Sodiomyces alcalophilus JCM 7366 TaxID=591952 RepID=UPI0039B46331